MLHKFLGAFAKSQKATLSFVMSVHLSAWNNSAPTRQTFMKFNTYFLKYADKFQVSSKPDNNIGHIT
jgi:hypothetical protein